MRGRVRNVRWRLQVMAKSAQLPASPTYLVIAASLNWLNTALWLLLWLSFTGRYWQGGLAVAAFGAVALVSTFAWLAAPKNHPHSRRPSVLAIVLLGFAVICLLILVAGP